MQEKKEEIRREGRCAPQGRAAVKGREKGGWERERGGGGVIGCEVMRLDLGFRKVWSERERGHIRKINT